MSCQHRPTDFQPRSEQIEAISLCHDHLSLRNHGTLAEIVSVNAGSGAVQRVVAGGRDTSTNLPFAATIVTLRSRGDTVLVTAAGRPDMRVRRSSTACVRDLSMENPDSILLDYTLASSTARGPQADRHSFIGVLLLTFAESGSRTAVNAMVRSHSLALIGGRKGPTPASDVWVFWIEDGPDNARTERLIDELSKSPLVHTAWPYVTPY